MRKVLTAEQMREVDRLTTERYGIPSIILMENAAHAVARVITEKLGGSVKGKSILILCGKGNNGGDGAALARILANTGADVEAILFGKIEETKGDARTNFDVLKLTDSRQLPQHLPHEFWKYGKLRFRELEEIGNWNRGFHVENQFDVVVDALFGTGLSRELDEDYYRVLGEDWFESDPVFRKGAKLTLSIDIPSGLPSDTGQKIGINACVDVTVTFTSPKFGNVLMPAARYGGELVVADIGSPLTLVEEVESLTFVSELQDVERFLYWTEFSSDSYKNKRGHALIVAGSESYSGAAVLAGNAAMRSGVGLVTLAVPAAIRGETAARALPEVIVRSFEDGLETKADAVLIGCGLEASEEANEAKFRKIIDERTTPVIADAGALPFVSKRADKSVGAPLILTPHEGEFLRLLGTDDQDAIKDRVAAVREYATSNNVILVLKGERVLIGAPDGRVVVNPTGNSGLGKAGNGDTLAGILVGFVAQAAKMDIDIFETVVAAVYIAGMAGDVAEKKYGKRVMTASDVRECLVEVFSELENS